MDSREDARLHLVFFLLFVGSFYLDPLMQSVLPAWRPPAVGFFSLAIGLIWGATFGIKKPKVSSDQKKSLTARLERLELRLRELEAENDAPDKMW
jgi:hypothetical protein